MEPALFVLGFIAGGVVGCVVTMWMDDYRYTKRSR